MRLSELLGRRVVTESGQRLGRIHDVHGELAGGRLRVIGIVPGRHGLLERYGIGRTRGRSGPGPVSGHDHPLIPWERVVRVGKDVIVRD